MCYKKSIGCKSVGCQSATSIKSKPSKPQKRCTHKYYRYIMRQYGMSLFIVITLTNHKTHNKGRDTGIDMHHCTTSKVERTHLLQESASPDPMCHGEIGYNNPQNSKHHISFKLYSFCKGTKYKCWCNQSKHALEHCKRKLGNTSRCNTVNGNTLQERLVESAHKEPSPRTTLLKSSAKCPSISYSHPKQRHNTNNEHCLHYHT